MRRFSITCLAVMFILSAAADSLTVRTVPAEGLCQAGEEAEFLIRVCGDDGKPLPGQRLRCELLGAPDCGGVRELATGPDGSVRVRAGLAEPGFLFCRVARGEFSAVAGVGFSPEKIRAVRPEPDDFSAWWSVQCRELAAMPLAPKWTPIAVAPELAGKIEAFDVEIPCGPGAPVRGRLARPKGAGTRSRPVEISFHGAGVISSRIPYERALEGMTAFDVNAHGIPNGENAEFYRQYSREKLHGYHQWFVNDRNRIYFRGMIRRACRAVQFAKSLPEWDGRNLIVSGTSQGGMQALAAAGLDSEVSCCVALVPALCDTGGFTAGRLSAWPRFEQAASCDPERGPEAAAYVDAVNFARQIRNASCFLSAGFRDQTSPASSVYAAFNAIPSGAKTLRNRPENGHEIAKETAEEARDFVRESIRNNR